MLRIERAAVEAVTAAATPADLAASVRDAIRLEFATIPPYLTAMLSLRPGTNRSIWWAIHDVVVDEMLHLLIGCNLLNALGERPVLDGSLVPPYPGALPMGIGDDLQVGLEPFSLDLVERVFMAIEEPEHPQEFPGPALAAATEPHFATIGEFYRALAGAVRDLGDPLPGDPARQVTSARWFSTERLFPLVDVDAAVRALTLVTEEGEGTPTSPIDPDGDVAHYYRFQAIHKGRALVADPASPPGYSFSGDPYHFDAGGVWPLTPNQHLVEVDPRTDAGAAVETFRRAFTRLLRALDRVVNGEPAHLDAAMGLMFELKLAGQRLAATPLRTAGVDSGPHAGPDFRTL